MVNIELAPTSVAELTEEPLCESRRGGRHSPGLPSLPSVFYVYLCSCIILCSFSSIFYAVVKQISMLFNIDNKDSVFCNKPTVSQCGRNATLNQSTNVVVIAAVVVVAYQSVGRTAGARNRELQTHNNYYTAKRKKARQALRQARQGRRD